MDNHQSCANLKCRLFYLSIVPFGFYDWNSLDKLKFQSEAFWVIIWLYFLFKERGNQYVDIFPYFLFISSLIICSITLNGSLSNLILSNATKVVKINAFGPIFTFFGKLFTYLGPAGRILQEAQKFRIVLYGDIPKYDLWFLPNMVLYLSLIISLNLLNQKLVELNL